MDKKEHKKKQGNMEGFVLPKDNLKPKIASKPVRKVAPINPAPVKQLPINDISNDVAPPLEVPKNQPDFPRYYSPYANNISRSRPQDKTHKKWSKKKKVLTSLLVVFLLFFAVGSWYGINIIGSLDKAFHGNIFSDIHALFSTTKLKGEDQGRVNILLAGDSSDDPGHQGADLTDSIMVVSIDTKNDTGFMLSIPRDLWVNIPGIGNSKINAANTLNNFNQPGYPSGGMGALQQIVQQDLGIPIDYYALIDYTAFKQAVDAVGGIQITINSPDPRGLYDAYTHLKLPNGLVTLNGQQALDLARARGDDAAGDISYGFPQSDFDRTQHQRQMLVALVKKSQTVGVLANPSKATGLINAFGDNIQTNLTLPDAIRLLQLTKSVSISKLQSVTYQYGGTNSILEGYTDPYSGQEALIPTAGIGDFSQLQQYYQELTSSNPVVKEGPSVVVLNGSNVTGQAKKFDSILTNDGFSSLGVADASTIYPNSLVVDLTNGQKPNSKALLLSLLPKGTQVTTSTSSPAEALEAQGYTSSFVVILGQDASNIQQP